MRDIVKRLRQRLCSVCGGDCSAANPPPAYCPKDEDNEAADEIERLNRLVDSLSAEVAATQTWHADWVVEHQQEVDEAHRQRIEAEAERDRLRAEVANLREAVDTNDAAFIDRMTAERDRLREEVAAVKNDAERYRWIKANHSIANDSPRIWAFKTPRVKGNDLNLDAEIDAALGKAKSKEGS